MRKQNHSYVSPGSAEVEQWNFRFFAVKVVRKWNFRSLNLAVKAVLKWNFTSLAVKAEQKWNIKSLEVQAKQKCGSRTADLWQSMQSRRLKCRSRTSHLKFVSPGRAEVELHIFGSPGRAEVAEQKCRTSHLLKSLQSRSAEA